MTVTSNITIRRAVPADIDAVRKLYADQLIHHKPFDERWQLDWPTTNSAEERLKVICADQARIMLVAEAPTGVVGYLIASIHTGHPASSASRIAELDSMHVLATLRRSGIGSALVDRFLDYCRSNEIDRVRLEATTANHPTIAFYKASGFVDYSSILIMDLK